VSKGGRRAQIAKRENLTSSRMKMGSSIGH